MMGTGAKRVSGRPPVYTKPRKKVTMELDAEGVQGLDRIAAELYISRTEAVDLAIALWIEKRQQKADPHE
jgi:metal-responsive CopG/Arc/MetJ family transcriptional regulator